MAEQKRMTKGELLEDIEREWEALYTAVSRLSETQMTGPQDSQGWTVKDHLIHLAAWERSVVCLLQGRPRHEGLGVSEAVYLSRDEEAINAAVQRKHREMPLEDALTQLRATHQELLTLLEPLTTEALNLPYRHYLPNEPGRGEGPATILVVHGNSAGHFAEHRPWILAIAD